MDLWDEWNRYQAYFRRGPVYLLGHPGVRFYLGRPGPESTRRRLFYRGEPLHLREPLRSLLERDEGFTHAEYEHAHAVARARGGWQIGMPIEAREEVLREADREDHWKAQDLASWRKTYKAGEREFW